MNSLEYWRKREQAQREKRIADEDERNRRIAQLYAEMQDAVQKQIDAFYGKYARAEGISIAEAKKRASQLDIDAYARKAKKYVREKDFTDKANAEMKLYNMTMKVNRLELLKAEIGSELCAGFSDLEKEFDSDLMSDAIGEMRRQSGILGVTISDQAERARSLVDASFHNATFSDRIWMYQEMLKNELATLLQEGLIQGKNSKELALHLTKTFGVSEHDSERLMRTEMTRVYTAAQQESLTEAGYDEYTFIAEPTACDVCLALDGQHFPVADLEDIGNHAPPIHPNCRCSVAAYMDREEFDRWLDEQGESETSLDEGFDEIEDKTDIFTDIHDTSDVIEEKSLQVNNYLETLGLPKSNWSGRTIPKKKAEFKRGYGKKARNCDIWIREDATIKTYIHEHLHARSISRTGQSYRLFRAFEEGACELLAEEICKKENLRYRSTYEEYVSPLRKFYSLTNQYSSAYDFAIDLFKIDPADREEWLYNISKGERFLTRMQMQALILRTKYGI